MSTPRTRTPSDIKWLANEMAALAGELERIDEQMARLRARHHQVRATRAELARVAGLMSVPSLPQLVPPVRAHPERGGRGAFRGFIREMLRTAYPGAVDTRALTAAAADRFGLQFPTEAERNHFRHRQVLKALQKLVDMKEVEALHTRKTGANCIGVWRWRVGAPTLADLRQLATTAEGE